MNTVVIDEMELREKRLLIIGVLETVKHWTKSEFYIDGKAVTAIQIERLFSIVDCEGQKTNEVVDRDYCYEGNGWGCKYLEEVSLRDRRYFGTNYYWYEFGCFEDGIWVVDKKRIKEIISSEANQKHLTLCRFFDESIIDNQIGLLPDTIEVSDESEWVYKYREAPAGIKQTEIIGVMPKDKANSQSNIRGSLSIGIGDLIKGVNEDEERATSKNTPTVTFADIGGIDDIVQQVREVIELPMIAPEIFEHYHLQPHKGIMLYGPPGCGKTLIAKAIANEIDAHFITVNGPEILNKFIGESENNLRRIFDEAKRMRPSLIYFDEFDAISTRRDTDDHLSLSSVVNQLLTLMDGITENNICCIASTNRIDMIDEAIKRPGRFDYVIEIKKPTPEGCKSIFRIHTDKMPVDASFDKDAFVEKYLIGFSGAEIAFVASEAAYNSIRRTVDISRIFITNEPISLSENNVITEMDFVGAATVLKERKKKADTAKYRYGY